MIVMHQSVLIQMLKVHPVALVLQLIPILVSCAIMDDTEHSIRQSTHSTTKVLFIPFL